MKGGTRHGRTKEAKGRIEKRMNEKHKKERKYRTSVKKVGKD